MDIAVRRVECNVGTGRSEDVRRSIGVVYMRREAIFRLKMLYFTVRDGKWILHSLDDLWESSPIVVVPNAV
jgi:hypothetical protein